ncbi:Gfo/Idh/MocA family oxidoreductase [Cellulophaga sp. 20_2_10]|uniref:Gfo/Idh/MocA family protein n=1 Tax=Cellulophaga sp. 20_2_10 TaxID=2942476 RepID=UPI00201A438E|nr:Gfo/Idh/MocA family oxidoreductase [Cellulophaga sp. 20_2_10]MCL5245527.1 Gfo/Idh/MocA family oxidoreductase [Cellulophaga sp. 20_2_10]
MTKIIKWGILGLGNIAQKFAEDLSLIEGAELVAVASRSKVKANDFSSKFNVKQAYDSYANLAKDPNVEAIYIATPHSYHQEHAILCMKHKKAVLCEKPFAMNLSEVNKMITVAKENNVLLMEALWTFFLPHYKYLLDTIKNQSLGKLEKLEADFGFKAAYDLESRFLKKEIGGGSLLDIGIYPIFAALSTLGYPKSIEANASFYKTGADSECNMFFNYDDATAVLKSTLLQETKSEAIYTFTDGVIKLNTRFHEPTAITITKNGKETTKDISFKGFGYYYEISHFNQLLRDNKKESDVMNFEFSRVLIKTIDKVRNLIGLEY